MQLFPCWVKIQQGNVEISYDNFNDFESSHANLRIVCFDFSKAQAYEITILGKKMILFESERDFLWHTLSKKDGELEGFHLELKDLSFTVS